MVRRTECRQPRNRIRETLQPRAYWRTVLYLGLGNRDEAIRLLEQGIADHEGLDIAWIKVDPLLDSLRGDPRFEALVQKVVGAK